MSTSRGTLPNLIIIGAMKCATTSLHYYLNLHPEISMSAQKELNFFTEAFNWHKGLPWYTSWFTEHSNVRGEASPSYTSYPYHTGIAERMYATIPDAKLIYLVRDPVERLLSHYMHSYIERKDHRPLDEVATDPSTKYICYSRYFTQLEQYLAYYPASQILIVEQEALRNRRAHVLREVFEFLDVDPDFYDPRYRWERHRTNLKRRKTALGLRLAQTRPMQLLQRLPHRLRWPIEEAILWPFSRRVERIEPSGTLRQRIVDLLQDDVARLRAHTGKSLENWSL